MTDPVRVGLVGYGMAGREFHAPLLRVTEGLTVSKVVTGDPERAESARHELGARVVSAYDDLLAAADELDLVVLATPTQLHAEQATAAIERGLAVVVDKPLATNLADARRVAALAVAAGVPVTTFQNRRWDPEHLTAKRLLAEGALGDVVRYEARYERWRPQPKDRWRENLTTDQGGGQLHDLQSHLVDGAVDLFGPITSVYAELAALTTAGDDVTFLAVEHRSGFAATSAPHRWPGSAVRGPGCSGAPPPTWSPTSPTKRPRTPTGATPTTNTGAGWSAATSASRCADSPAAPLPSTQPSSQRSATARRCRSTCVTRCTSWRCWRRRDAARETAGQCG